MAMTIDEVLSEQRLTDDKVADALAENAVKLITVGIAVDISNLRYIKLNRYERVNENGGNSDD
jgi:hypothetical protein